MLISMIVRMMKKLRRLKLMLSDASVAPVCAFHTDDCVVAAVDCLWMLQLP